LGEERAAAAAALDPRQPNGGTRAHGAVGHAVDGQFGWIILVFLRRDLGAFPTNPIHDGEMDEG